MTVMEYVWMGVGITVGVPLGRLGAMWIANRLWGPE